MSSGRPLATLLAVLALAASAAGAQPTAFHLRPSALVAGAVPPAPPGDSSAPAARLADSALVVARRRGPVAMPGSRRRAILWGAAGGAAVGTVLAVLTAVDCDRAWLGRACTGLPFVVAGMGVAGGGVVGALYHRLRY